MPQVPWGSCVTEWAQAVGPTWNAVRAASEAELGEVGGALVWELGDLDSRLLFQSSPLSSVALGVWFLILERKKKGVTVAWQAGGDVPVGLPGSTQRFSANLSVKQMPPTAGRSGRLSESGTRGGWLCTASRAWVTSGNSVLAVGTWLQKSQEDVSAWQLVL